MGQKPNLGTFVLKALKESKQKFLVHAYGNRIAKDVDVDAS